MPSKEWTLPSTDSTTRSDGAPIGVWLCDHNHRFVTVGTVYAGPVPGRKGKYLLFREVRYDVCYMLLCPCGKAFKAQANVKRGALRAAEAAFLLLGWEGALDVLRRTWPCQPQTHYRDFNVPVSMLHTLPQWSPADFDRWGFYRTPRYWPQLTPR